LEIYKFMALSKIIITGGIVKVLKTALYDFQEQDFEVAEAVSYLGTPIYGRLIFEENSYKTLSGDTIQYPETIIENAIITINEGKNIVKTSIPGRKGTIKEYINTDDFSINIEAIIVQKDNIFPEDELLTLKNILKSPVAVPVAQEVFNIFDINNIVIENYNITQKRGYRNNVFVTINAISDEIIDLENV